jgi:hypothetical protein
MSSLSKIRNNSTMAIVIYETHYFLRLFCCQCCSNMQYFDENSILLTVVLPRMMLASDECTIFELSCSAAVFI